MTVPNLDSPLPIRYSASCMRDLLFVVALLGVLIGVGCGTARASAKLDLAQNRAESPNYSLEYLGEEATPGRSNVQGEQDVQFQPTEPQPAPSAAELPATNPPYLLISAAAAAVLIAIIAYLALK